MNPIATLDAAGRPRSPATLPGYHAGRAPRNKGRRYPADPPRVEEIIAVMRRAGERPAGVRFRGLAVVLWRAGLRISEALALSGVTSSRLAARCWSATAREASAAKSEWTIGDGSSWTLPCGRCVLVRCGCGKSNSYLLTGSGLSNPVFWVICLTPEFFKPTLDASETPPMLRATGWLDMGARGGYAH